MWNRKKTIIIAGCSRFGAGLAGELSEHGDDVIIIDKDNDAFRKLPPNFSGFRIVGMSRTQTCWRMRALGMRPWWWLPRMMII